MAEKYYVPLLEEDLVQTFIVLSKGSSLETVADSDINTFIAVTIAFDGTEILW